METKEKIDSIIEKLLHEHAEFYGAYYDDEKKTITLEIPNCTTNKMAITSFSNAVNNALAKIGHRLMNTYTLRNATSVAYRADAVFKF